VPVRVSQHYYLATYEEKKIPEREREREREREKLKDYYLL